MTTQIQNQNAFRAFLVNKFGGDKLTENQARKFGIDEDKFEEINDNDNNYVELDSEILKDDDLYEQFATMFVEEQKKADDKNAEKEKEEQNKVSSKNGAGAA